MHFVIHRETSVSRDFEPELHSLLKESAKGMSHVEARPLNSRLFAVLSKEMQVDNNWLLLHSEVRWF
jgi:hypothetical protein